MLQLGLPGTSIESICVAQVVIVAPEVLLYERLLVRCLKLTDRVWRLAAMTSQPQCDVTIGMILRMITASDLCFYSLVSTFRTRITGT